MKQRMIIGFTGKRSERDFDLLGPGDAYGATLTGWTKNHELEFEPYAAKGYERYDALSKAHDRGIYTWVSLEPIIDPEQTLDIIAVTHPFVDEYKLGKWNYDPRANKINWADFLNKAIIRLEKFEKKYYIKQDLRPYLGSLAASLPGLMN